MAKCLTDITKSQYYLDNKLNWTVAQCNVQINPLLLPMASIFFSIFTMVA